MGQDGMDTKPEPNAPPLQFGAPTMNPGNPQPGYGAQPYPGAQPAHPIPTEQQYQQQHQQQQLPQGYVYPATYQQPAQPFHQSPGVPPPQAYQQPAGGPPAQPLQVPANLPPVPAGATTVTYNFGGTITNDSNNTNTTTNDSSHKVNAEPTAAPAHMTVVVKQPQAQSCCSGGWVLFGFGIFIPILLVAGIFVPYCTKEPSDYHAQKACIVLLVIYIILIAVVSAN